MDWNSPHLRTSLVSPVSRINTPLIGSWIETYKLAKFQLAWYCINTPLIGSWIETDWNIKSIGMNLKILWGINTPLIGSWIETNKKIKTMNSVTYKYSLLRELDWNMGINSLIESIKGSYKYSLLRELDWNALLYASDPLIISKL